MLCISLKICGLPNVGILSAGNDLCQWFQRVRRETYEDEA
jgi:hypothetical protein